MKVLIHDPIIRDVVHAGEVIKTFWCWAKVKFVDEISGYERSRWIHNSYLVYQ